DIQHWLAVSRRCLAIARQSNPSAVVGLDSHMQVKLNTAVSANSQVVNAVGTPRKAALAASSNREVESGSLWWNCLLAGEDGINPHAVVCYSSDIEFIFVYLLASHHGILCHKSFSYFSWQWNFSLPERMHPLFSPSFMVYLDLLGAVHCWQAA